MKHELILTRSNHDTNAIMLTSEKEDVEITLTKIEWLMPYHVLTLNTTSLQYSMRFSSTFDLLTMKKKQKKVLLVELSSETIYR